MPIKIDPIKCVKHDACPAATSCPMGAFIQKAPKTVPVIDFSKCVECQMCVSLCPEGAISFEA